MVPYATDISSAYLEAYTNEKVCIRAGPEFGNLEGHLLIIIKAHYELQLSGKIFNQLLAECLEGLGFKRSLADKSIFIRPSPDGTVYKYIATYVDDLCIIAKDPELLLEQLKGDPNNFDLKGLGPVNFHLGCGFKRDSDGILCMTPCRYVKKMVEAYKRMFGEKPNDKNIKSPLVKGDNPELDTSEFLNEDGIEKYQSLIGSMQWAVSIEKWDINISVMTLSSFRAQPRQGHLDRAKRVYTFLRNFKHFQIRFRTDEPDFSTVPEPPSFKE